MKVQDYEIKADTLFGGVGHIVELGDYAGRYSNEAFDALRIDSELEDVEWCDIMITDDGKIYAVAGDTEAHNTGNFYFKQIFDGVKGDGEILESLSIKVATFNVYYHGTNVVDYSKRFLKLANGTMLIYSTNEQNAYISLEDELNDAKDDYEDIYDGYWE